MSILGSIPILSLFLPVVLFGAILFSCVLFSVLIEGSFVVLSVGKTSN